MTLLKEFRLNNDYYSCYSRLWKCSCIFTSVNHLPPCYDIVKYNQIPVQKVGSLHQASQKYRLHFREDLKDISTPGVFMNEDICRMMLLSQTIAAIRYGLVQPSRARYCLLAGHEKQIRKQTNFCFPFFCRQSNVVPFLPGLTNARWLTALESALSFSIFELFRSSQPLKLQSEVTSVLFSVRSPLPDQLTFSPLASSHRTAGDPD